MSKVLGKNLKKSYTEYMKTIAYQDEKEKAFEKRLKEKDFEKYLVRYRIYQFSREDNMDNFLSALHSKGFTHFGRQREGGDKVQIEFKGRNSAISLGKLASFYGGFLIEDDYL